MAPARRKAAAGARGRKLSAFLKDFDREVRSRVEQLRTNGERLVKEMENLYDVELLRLPAALREMNWLEFFAKGGSQKVVEEAVTVTLTEPQEPRAARG
ncbi:borealin-like [Gallus gallus]|uniref:borealin-like n=1 Tax=Gallus gallus TaxID=9031 RepID=UPI000739AD1B|nr:borealin-like [Gallus gallus]|eukprot:XP_024997918.1 borealin-like isoform X3 [Gallus gallus]